MQPPGSIQPQAGCESASPLRIVAEPILQATCCNVTTSTLVIWIPCTLWKIADALMSGWHRVPTRSFQYYA